MDDEVRALAEASPMILVGARGARGEACLGRGVGLEIDADGGALEVLVSRLQWPETLDALVPGVPMSLTLCRAADYRAFQLKGTVTSRAPADAAGLARARRYRDAVFSILGGLGVPDLLIANWLVLEQLVAVRFEPSRAYDQTPGPAAGSALARSRP